MLTGQLVYSYKYTNSVGICKSELIVLLALLFLIPGFPVHDGLTEAPCIVILYDNAGCFSKS